MKKTLLALLLLSGCGGGDGDTKEAPETLTCIKDGVEYVINPDGTYQPIRDVVIEQELLSEEGRVEAYMVRDIILDGVTIIADCGSSVNVSVNATDPTTNTDTDVNSNNTSNENNV